MIITNKKDIIIGSTSNTSSSSSSSGGGLSENDVNNLIDNKIEQIEIPIIDNGIIRTALVSSTDVSLEKIKTYLELDVSNATSLTFLTPNASFVGNGYITILNGSSLSTFGNNTVGLDSETFTNKDTFAYFILNGIINFKRVI